MKNRVLSMVVVAVLTAITNSPIEAQPEVWYPNPAYMYWEYNTPEPVAYNASYGLGGLLGFPSHLSENIYYEIHNNPKLGTVCPFETANDEPQTIYGVALSLNDNYSEYPFELPDCSISFDIVLYQFTPGDSNLRPLKEQSFVKEMEQQPDLYLIHYEEMYLYGDYFNPAWDSLFKFPMYEFYFDTPIEISGNFYVCISSKDTFSINTGASWPGYSHSYCQNGYDGLADMTNNVLIYYYSGSSACGRRRGGLTDYETWGIPAPQTDTMNTNRSQLAYPIIRPKGYLTATKPTEDVGSVRLLPNPARTRVTVEAADAIKDVQVSDMAGRVLITKWYPGDARAVTLDIESLPRGSYVVRVKTEKKETVQKLVVN